MSLGIIKSLGSKITRLSFIVAIIYSMALSGYSFNSFQEDQSNDSISPRINHEMLQMFENFKERGAISESLYYQLIQSTDSADAIKWRKVLEKYMGAVSEGNDPLAEEEIIELIEADPELLHSIDLTQDSIARANTEIPVEIQESETEQIVIEEAITTGDNIAVSNSERILTVNQTMVRYHIQIAASTEPLSNRYLEGLYNGELEINHFTEDDWYKYSIDGAETLSE